MTETSVDPSSFRPFEVTAVHLVYVGLGFFIVLFGMFSLFIKERLYLGEAPLAAVFGIIVGPAALNLFNPSHWANNGSGAPGGHITDEISLEVLRVTIALSVFAVGVELPKKYLLRHWRSIIFLLGPVMIWGWLITALFMYALVPGLDFLNSLVVASCVTPTDPILAQAVVGGPWAEKHVPAHLRHILMCESGCNDGAAFPFLYLALFLTLHRDNRGKAIAEWFYDALAYQIIFGTLLGALIGWAARKLMRFSERHKLVDRESFVAQYVSLAIASMGVNVLLGSDDLLAAFACGTAFAWDGWFTKQTEDSNFSSIVDLLFNVAVFVYIGALMPFRDWAGGTADEPNTLNLWRLFVLAICVLLTKRIPIVIALWKWIPDIKTFREAVFAGHFGPIGVGAIFIATLARTELPEEIPSPPETSNDVLALVVQPIIYFFVICSITIHGLTIPFFAFSKNATRMTRTWSRNPSFGKFDTEPGWVSRMRKRTGEDLKEEEGGMSEIERVLNAQLRQIGKGAIGGEDEKELARMETNGGSGSGSGYGLPTRSAQSSSSSGADAITPQAKVQFDADYIDEEGRDDVVGDEWGGDDTIEMRRYREKQKAKKETEYAKLRQRQQEHDEDIRKSQDEKQHDSEKGDLGGAEMMDEERGAMDRDIPKSRSEKRHEEEEEEEEEGEDAEKRRKEKGLFSHLQSSGSSSSSTKQEREHEKIRQECEEHYPKSRSWTEGNVLIIEYQKSKLSEVECHKLPILEHEKDAIVGQDDPAHAWALQHADGLQYYAGLEDANNWSPSEAVHHLVHNRIPKKYSEIMARRKKRRNSDAESKEQQDARFNALYGGMTYASERRHDEDENDYKRSYEENDGRVGVQGKARGSSHKKAIKQHRERTPSPPVTGWLAPRVEDIARQKQLKASRRRGGRATSPKGSMSPPGSASPTGFGDIFGQRQGPKEYKCSSEARRRNMKKKLMAGKISLCPNAAEEEETNEEIVESPTSFSGLGVPRTSSAGGLGQSSSSQSSGRRTMFNSNSSSNALLSIPRTLTNSSQDSNSINNRSMAQFVPGIRANHDHSRSSSVQWLDINDESHDHRSSRRNNLSGTDHPSIRRTSSPTRMNKVDLARIGGGISRPSSGQGRRLQNQMSMTGADTPEEKKDDGDDQQSVYASSSNSKQTQKRRSRFGTLLSSIASGNSPTSAFERARQQSPQQMERPSTAPTGSNNEGNALAPSSPAIIVGAGEYPGGEGGGGILADGNASVYSGSGVETPKRQQTQPQTPQQHQQNADSPAGNERGVTFEF